MKKLLITLLLICGSLNAQINLMYVAETSAANIDTIPSAFSFTDETLAELSTEYTSDSIIVSGIIDSAGISVTGGTYRVGLDGSFTGDADYAQLSDTVWVKGTSSASYETAVNVVLTIGGVSDTYTITTVEIPDSSAIDTSGVSRVYFVDALYGDDSNDGLSGLTAWQTFEKIRGSTNGSNFQRGDSVLFRKGQTHSWEDVTVESSDIVGMMTMDEVYFGAYGTGAKPIIDTYGKRLMLSYGSSAPVACVGVTFDGLHFYSSQTITNGTWLFGDYDGEDALTDSTTFKNCYFDGSNLQTGVNVREIITWNGDYFHIHDCELYNSWDQAVYLGGRYGIVENCVFDSAGYGASAMATNDKVKGITIRYNTFKDTKNAFISADNTDSTIFHHNLIVTQGINYVSNIFGHTGDSLLPSSNVRVYNNTFVMDHNSSYEGSAIDIYDTAGLGWEFKNNLVVFDNSSGGSWFTRMRTDSTYVPSMESNLYYSDNYTYWRIASTNQSSLANWQSTMADKGTNVLLADAFSLNTDPLFTSMGSSPDYSSGDYTLSNSSPAIDAGVIVYDWDGNALNTDLDGNSIVGKPDIGAYENQSINNDDSLYFDGASGSRVYHNADVTNFEFDDTTTLRIRFKVKFGTMTTATRYLGVVGHSRIGITVGGTGRCQIRFIPDNEQASSFYSITSSQDTAVWHDVEIYFNLGMAHPVIKVNGVVDTATVSGTNTLSQPDWADAGGNWITFGDFGYSTGYPVKCWLKEVRISNGAYYSKYDWTPSSEGTDEGNNGFTLTAGGGVF